MPNWRDQYLSNLKDADLSNPVNMDLVQNCSHMADRIAALEAEKASLESSVSKIQKTTAPPTQSSTADDPGVTQLKFELAEALRSKGVAETRLRKAEEELTKLRSKTKGDSRSIRELTADRATLTTRVKDREHELREKRKLVENVQDEMIALNLQLSMAEKERDKAKKENKELVDRWMKRMAQEADAMNLANEPIFEKGR
ncbi:Fc.00g007250.m01.CDS01 [Cosmosporella sp. VM-42]